MTKPKPKPRPVYTLEDAALYLDITVPGVKYHIYQSGQLKPDRYIGRTPVFYQETLDAFNEQRRKPGRPPSKPRSDQNGEGQ